MNELITDSRVKLIWSPVGEEGEQPRTEVLSRSDALKLAASQGLDLVCGEWQANWQPFLSCPSHHLADLPGLDSLCRAAPNSVPSDELRPGTVQKDEGRKG